MTEVAEGISWEESEASARAPVFLDEPIQISGDGWSFESRAQNLGELDVIGLAEAFPSYSVSLVDVHSGQVIAVGTFRHDYMARIIHDPLRLAVANTNEDLNNYLLLFDLSTPRPRLVTAIPIRERPGFQEGFGGDMDLSADQRLIYVEHREQNESPECTESEGDAYYCYNYSVGVVDLKTLDYEVWTSPGRCAGFEVHDSDAAPFVECGGNPIPSGCEATDKPFPRRACESDPLASARWRFHRFSGERFEELALGCVEYAPFVASMPDGSVRVITTEGFLLEDCHARPVKDMLESSEPLETHFAFRTGERTAVIGVNPQYMYIDELRMVDLEDGSTLGSVQMPDELISVAVLDADRALVMLQNHDGDTALQKVDLDAIQLGDLVELTGLAGEPQWLVR